MKIQWSAVYKRCTLKIKTEIISKRVEKDIPTYQWEKKVGLAILISEYQTKQLWGQSIIPGINISKWQVGQVINSTPLSTLFKHSEEKSDRTAKKNIQIHNTSKQKISGNLRI